MRTRVLPDHYELTKVFESADMDNLLSTIRPLKNTVGTDYIDMPFDVDKLIRTAQMAYSGEYYKMHIRFKDDTHRTAMLIFERED